MVISLVRHCGFLCLILSGEGDQTPFTVVPARLPIAASHCRSRNDAIANLAVLAAAAGVFGTGWPDIVVAAVMATLSVSGAVQIVRHALVDLRSTRTLAAAE